MKPYFFVAVLMILLISLSVFSQDLTDKKSVFKPSELVQKPSGFLNYLIDPAKFEMSHSYSLSYLSSGDRSTNVGLYLNTMTYRFSDPLLMQLRIGYMHQPFGGDRSTLSSQQGNFFLQGAHLLYRPTKNMIISFDYESYPFMMVSPYRYGW
ncbi:hypothetical protein JW835_15465 [bacterium]|nr:hypothetical protein [bacterium]